MKIKTSQCIKCKTENENKKKYCRGCNLRIRK